MMRGLAGVEVNCPNVTLFAKRRLPKPFPPPACNEPTSKRGVLVLCFRPKLGRGTTPARECLNVKRGQCDLLFVKRWVAFHNLLWSCSLTQHVRDQLDWNPCPPVDR